MVRTRVAAVIGAACLARCKWIIAAWAVGCMFAVAGIASAAPPTYSIVPLGLDDLEHTRNDGSQYSYASLLNEAGQVGGYSDRFNGGSSAWFYDGATTLKIGLTGPEHTSDSGEKNSNVKELNEAGQVIGHSNRYNGGSTFLGSSAWFYDGAMTISIGFTGPEYARNDGFQSNIAHDLNEAGQVVGSSSRYIGSTNVGSSTWLYAGGTTRYVGLVDSEHTRDDGLRTGSSLQLNEAGQIAGNSARYNGNTFFGASAWLDDGVTTLNIGLVGSEHTRNDGYKSSTPTALNQAGQVMGTSLRYNGGPPFPVQGTSAWLYNGATTNHIGLVGAEHTNSFGLKSSTPIALNQTGQVIGTSDRYNGGSISLGKSAWRYDGGTTLDIGLVGSEHTRNDGFKSSTLTALNQAGQASGNSQRYNGGSINLGQSAWLYDGVTTIDIGLTGPEHTRNDGFKRSDAILTEVGMVLGVSQRFNGGTVDLGFSTWLYNGVTTSQIGLTGTEYTRNDGFKSSPVEGFSQAGQAIGYSNRYNGGSIQLGQDAWYYDPTLGQTFVLQLSMRSDGRAFSNVSYLGDDGLVLGAYQRYDAMDNALGFRLFSFTVADGMHDLGLLERFH